MLKKIENDEMIVGGIFLFGFSAFMYLIYKFNQNKKMVASLPVTKAVSMGVRG